MASRTSAASAGSELLVIRSASADNSLPVKWRFASKRYANRIASACSCGDNFFISSMILAAFTDEYYSAPAENSNFMSGKLARFRIATTNPAVIQNPHEPAALWRQSQVAARHKSLPGRQR